MIRIKVKQFFFVLSTLILCIFLNIFSLNVSAEEPPKSSHAYSLFDEARKAFNEEDYQTALEKINASLSIYREIGDQQSEADLLTWKAAIRLQLDDNFAEILDCLNNAKEIYKGLNSKPGDKSALKSINSAISALEIYIGGVNYRKTGEYQLTLQKFNEALRIVKEMGESGYVADILSRIGIVYQMDLKNYSEAEKYYKDALMLYKSLNRKNEVARMLVNMASVNFDKNNHSEALNLVNKAIDMSSKKEVKAYALSWAGRIYYAMGDYNKAQDYYKKAAISYKKIIDKKGEADTLTWVGWSTASMGYLKMSLEYYTQALDIIQELKYVPKEGEILQEICSAYYNIGSYKEAISSCKKAMQIYKKVDKPKNHGEVLVLIGLADIEMGNYLEAIDNFQNALTIFKEQGDSYGQENANEGLLKAYELLGDKKKAAEYALARADETDSKTSLGQIFSLMDQAEVFKKENTIDMALDTYNKALKLSKESGNKKSEIIVLDRIGSIYLSAKDYTKALEYFTQALEISKEHRDKIGELTALKYIGHVYFLKFDFLNALEYYQQALKTIKEIGSTKFEIDVLLYIGRTYSDLKLFEESERYFKQALVLSNEIGSVENKWKIQTSLSSIAVNSGNLQKAKSYLAEAINTIESLRDLIAIEKYRTTFIEDKLVVYVNMVVVLLRLNQEEEAFHYIERAKSRTLLDLLGSRVIEKGSNKEWGEEERKLKKKIKELLEKIQQQSELNEKQNPILSEWNKELERTREKYRELLLKIKKEHSELYSLVSVNPLTLKEVQNIIDPDITLLEFFTLKDGVGLWIVNKSEFKHVVQLIPFPGLESKVLTLREKITTLQPDYEKNARELYDLLIKPAKPYIKTKRIGIVPHAILHYLPFQALLNDENKFLIEEYDLFYTPSASVLKFVYEKRKDIKGKVLAFGNPKLDDEKLDLPYAEDEVKRIKGTYPQTTLYIKERATEEKVKKLSGEYNVIHFASHGELNPASPMSSNIRLAREKDEDGRLEVNEIFNLDLKNTSLVTLSACETGLGKLSSGDELIGLTRGFIYAGAPSIVASLWKVNDQSTSEFMNLFYKNLKSHPKSEALRMAQLEMIRGKTGKGIVRGVGGITGSKEATPKEKTQATVDGSHPYFWAPFILVGDWK